MTQPVSEVARPPALEALALSKRIGDDVLALDAVSLQVPPGEIYCLVGASGAGKTLLLHMFVGLAMPSAGRAFVFGADAGVDCMSARRQLAYIPKGAPMYSSLTARQNVEFFARAGGSKRRLDRNECCHAMRRMGIAERHFEARAGSLPSSVLLSLWLAIALLRDAPILLIDEPTAAADPYAAAALQEMLGDLRAGGKTLLVATSDVLLAGAVADRVAILKEGRKRIELTRPELVGRSLFELYLEYMGRPLAPGKPSLGDAHGS